MKSYSQMSNSLSIVGLNVSCQVQSKIISLISYRLKVLGNKLSCLLDIVKIWTKTTLKKQLLLVLSWLNTMPFIFSVM